MIHALASALNVHARVAYIGNDDSDRGERFCSAAGSEHKHLDTKGKGKAKGTVHEGFVEFNYEDAACEKEEDLLPVELVCR